MVEMAKVHDLNSFQFLTYILEYCLNKDMGDEQLAITASWSEKVKKACKNK